MMQSLQAASPSLKNKVEPAIDGKNRKTKAAPVVPPKNTAPPPPPPIAPGAPAPNGKAKAKAKPIAKIFLYMSSGCIHGDNWKFSYEAFAPNIQRQGKHQRESVGMLPKLLLLLSLLQPCVSHSFSLTLLTLLSGLLILLQVVI